MSTRNTIAALIQTFFLDFLVARRGLSSNTIISYRDGIRLLLNFAAEQRHIPVDKLAVEDFDNRAVVDFLDYLQSVRGNATRSRNTRLAPIHGLFRYIAGQVPEAMARCQQICAIPNKKTAHQSMEYLEDAEIGAMLGSIEANSRHRLRDHSLMLFMYNTGARVQEVVDMKLDDLRLDTPPQARLHGKGGKQRACPLWAETVQALRSYLDHREPSQETCRFVFLNANGQPFTRFGIRYLVRQYAAKAAHRCLSLKDKNVGPHTIRHSTAMHMLQSGNDLSVIKEWLGHANMSTTHEYAAIDMKMKQRALDTCHAPTTNRKTKGRPRWLKPGILKWLDDLSEGAGIM